MELEAIETEANDGDVGIGGPENVGGGDEEGKNGGNAE